MGTDTRWRRRTGPALAGVVGAVLLALDGDAPPDPATQPDRSVRSTALRDELLQMMRDDQLERTGEGLPPGTKLPFDRDYDRATRLQQIVASSGWPSHTRVGEDGGTAAWLVAQHADFDFDFQAHALTLMRRAAAQGEADVTEVAYLADRVAVNRGEPQEFGTQVRCRDGRPDPATPLESPDQVDALRLRVGMEPLATYYDELALMCADEAAAGVEAGP